ncbi:MAG: dTDP-4-dehydrorhamnose 3,5-epimerase family protein [Candidatus Obscuribacterales bacterium]|nr:dTDP-4-dehydrorhamnose 3,5-epimerase family protein [Candidatus Obscuribacterales bacterium]
MAQQASQGFIPKPLRVVETTPVAKPSIEGVIITRLKQIEDERGKLMHMLRADDSHFMRFGEVYFSVVNPAIVKGWHIHSVMTLNYAVVYGQIRLVMYDDRLGSPTRGTIQEILLGESNYNLVTIPPNIWNAFKGLSSEPAIVANCATHPHEANEIRRIDPFHNDIPYDWEKHG